MEHMISELPQFLQFSYIPYELLVVIIGFLEGLPIIGSLVPGGTLALVIGTYVQSGTVNFWLSVIGLGLGSFLGDMTGYMVGRFSKKTKFIQKLIAKERVQTGLELFEKRLFVILVLGRLIPLVRSAPSLIAGAHHIKLSKYIGYSFMGSMFWSLVGVVIGMVTGKFIGQYVIPAIVSITVVIVIAIALKHKAYFQKI